MASLPAEILAGVAPGVTLAASPVPRVGPAPFGLYSTVVDPGDVDPHWVNSILWEHHSCSSVDGYTFDCDEGTTPQASDFRVNDNSNATQQVATSFSPVATHTCSPVGYDLSQASDFAKQALLSHEQEATEDAISAATFDTVPSFQGATVLNPTADPVSLRLGIGLLAQHAAMVYGAPGAVIHVPRFVSGFAGDLGISERSGTMYTITGEKVSFGAGYSNGSPATPSVEAGPDEAWLYVTPPLFILQTDIRTYGTENASAFNRANNDLTMFAERTILVGWDDCPVGAVLVDLN